MKTFLDNNKSIGIFVLRLSIGCAFAFIYGLMKVEGGPELWTMIGGTMSHVGITFAPTFWGFMATMAEFAGGILIILGLFTRITSVFMGFTMIMATITHLIAKDPWYTVMNPVNMLAVFICLFFVGAGKYSIDYLISKRKSG